MSTLQAIQKANYLATEADVENLAREYVTAQHLLAGSRTTYFRILLAGTQVALAGKPVLRAKPSASILDDQIPAHLEAFENVNARLYAAVVRGSVTPDVADAPNLSTDEANRRASERNRRNNYARSAASTIRSYIRAGHDITRISVLTATKNSMAVANSTRSVIDQSPEERLHRRVKAATSRLAGLVTDLAGMDRSAATAALQETMAQVSDLLLKYGGRPVTKPEQAVAEHKMWKGPGGVFWPTTRVEHRTQ